MATAPSDMHAIAKLLRYLALVLPDVLFEEFRDKLVELAPSTTEATVNYYEKVIEQGRAEGVAAGRAEGVLDGLRAGLLKQLRVKFGGLESPVLQRIEQASAEDLERWLEMVLVADTLDAVIER
ncbi:MAG: hypothetical protein IAG13_35605 [Deltaproteobacteria bacterium]|nr:hypothetical protein [Nannocystaceae bacterium]